VVRQERDSPLREAALAIVMVPVPVPVQQGKD